MTIEGLASNAETNELSTDEALAKFKTDVLQDPRKPKPKEQSEEEKWEDLLKWLLSRRPKDYETIIKLKNLDPSEKKAEELMKHYVDHLAISALAAHTYKWFSLWDILLWIDTNSLLTTKKTTVYSYPSTGGDKRIEIKDGSTIAKLLQAYLVFVEGESVQFIDNKSTNFGIDGKVQRFSKQAITNMQHTWREKQANYTEWTGNIYRKNYEKIKNTKKDQNNNAIRWTYDGSFNTLNWVKLIYTPGTQKMYFDSYKQKSEINLSNGELTFRVNGVACSYPFSFPFVRNDSREILKDDIENGPNAMAIDQITKTSLVIHQMIDQFIKPGKTNSDAPFFIWIDGSLRFSTHNTINVAIGWPMTKSNKTNIPRYTKVVQDHTMDNLLINHAAITSSSLGWKQEIADFLNKIYRQVHPKPEDDFRVKNSKDMIIDIKNRVAERKD